MSAPTPPIPQTIRLQENGRFLRLSYPDGNDYRISAELLRVYSPSAEVRGHGHGQEKLQTGKAEVCLTDIQAAGQYALKLTFSDGHDSGLYNWHYLHNLAQHADAHWQDYLQRLHAAGASRFVTDSEPR